VLVETIALVHPANPPVASEYANAQIIYVLRFDIGLGGRQQGAAESMATV
jgi:hypothetical protein